MMRSYTVRVKNGAAVLLLFLLSHGAAFAQSDVPADGDIPTLILGGNYDLRLQGNATWNTPVYINSVARSSLFIDGGGNIVTLPASYTGMLRDFIINNNIAIRNVDFRPSASYPNQGDYLIGAITAGITTNLDLAGTSFSGFSRADNRGGTIIYAYGLGAVVNIDAGDAGLVFRGNRGQGDAAGAVAVAFSNLTFSGNVTFDSNWTGNYGGAVVAYDYNNNLNFKGVTTFTNNHSVVFGGALDVWGGQATVVFDKPTTFDGNYVHYKQDMNDYDTPTHINDQHARGGAINIGYVASLGNGASVTFNDFVTFSNNYVVSAGTRLTNRNALGGAVSVYGNGLPQNYSLIFKSGALFENNYVYATTGTGNGGAIYYDSSASQLSLGSGTRFIGNYAKTYGGAIYLQSGILSLSAVTDDIVFQGNRHGVSFDGSYKPVSGTGTPNAIYLGSSGTLNLVTANDHQIGFYDPIASIAGSFVVVNKTGAGEVVFYGDGTTSGEYDSVIQATTNVQGGFFTLAGGVKYGDSSYGTFTIQGGGVARGGENAALLANKIVVEGGGAIGVVGGAFTVDSPSIAMQDGAILTGAGSLGATSDIVMAGTVTARVEGASSLNITGNLAGTGGLEKTGGGVLVLSSANAYTGPTTISGGGLTGGIGNAFSQSSSVTVGAGGVLDTGGYKQKAANLGGAGDVVLSGSGNLTAQMSSDASLSGTVSGDGALIKTGAANLTLSGDNTYAGGTTISAGSLTATRGTALGTGTAAIVANATLDLAFAGDEELGNRLGGVGTVVKSASGTARLTGDGSSVGAVSVTGGVLYFEQNGAFSSGTYTTAGGATTSLSSESTLAIGGSFTQDAGSTLTVAVGDVQPAISADTAQLAGDLYVAGFYATPASARASRFNGTSYTVISTDNGIAGDFDSQHIGDAADPADYLTITGGITNGGKDYTITLGLAWFAGPTRGNGIFTLGEAADLFNVDVVLSNQLSSSVPWSGRDLTKRGLGTLVLSRENTYSGFTRIEAGTLRTAVADAFKSSTSVIVGTGAKLQLGGNNQTARNLEGSGSIALGGATLTVANNTNTGFAGSIAGSGSLVKTGAGELFLSGTNTYGGGTTIGNGTLRVAAAGALGGGAIAIGDAGTLDLRFSADETVANVIGGTGALEITGAATATLTASGSAGSATVNSGTLEFAFAQTGNFSTVDSYVTKSDAATTIGENSSLIIGSTFTQESGSTLNVAVGANNEPAITAKSATLDGTLEITGFGTGVIRNANDLPEKSFMVIKTADGIAGDFGSVIIDTVVNSVDYVTVDGSKSADGKNYSVYFGLTWFAGATLGNGVFTLSDASDIFDVNVPLVDRSPSATGWNGVDLTKMGGGVLVLSRQNTYSGLTSVEGGTLRTDAVNAFADSSEVYVNSGARLNLNGNDQIARMLNGAGRIVLGAAELTLVNDSGEDTKFSGNVNGAGSLTKKGAGKLTLSGASSYSGGTAIQEGTLAAEIDSALGRGNVDIASGARLELAFDADAIFANMLSGAGDLEKIGNGVATLTAKDSSVGTVLVSGGTVSLGQSGAFRVDGAYTTANGAATTIQSGSTLEVGSDFTQAGGSTLNVAVGQGNDPAITAARAVIGGDLHVTGLATPARASDSSGMFTVISTTEGVTGAFASVTLDAVSTVDYLTAGGRVTDDGNSYVVGLGLTWLAGPTLGNGVFTLAKASDSFEVDVVLEDRFLSATGWDGRTLTKNGAGTLVLERSNLYTGETIVNAGTLTASADNAIANSVQVTVASKGKLALAGNLQTIQNLNGTGAVTLAAATTNLTEVNSIDTIFSGVISGAGSVTKAGAGALTLSGGNSYAGGTSVSEGQLIATTASALGSGVVALDSGGTLTLEFASKGTFGNLLSGTGTLEKTESGAVTLAANGSSVGSALVKEGELILGPSVEFTAEEFETSGGATTSIGGGSRLVAGTFTQGATATLNVTVSSGNNPAIQAVDATLAGALNVSGFIAGAFGDAQSLVSGRYTVVAASGSLSGDFTNVTIGGASSPPNYLVIDSFRDANSYQIGFGLAWLAGPGESTGTFTLDKDEAFDVNVPLGNEQGWNNWDGRSLTKDGVGTLTLSSENTYAGDTSIEGGVLVAGEQNAFAQSSRVIVGNGATLKLNKDQKANQLEGEGTIDLGSSYLTANNSSQTVFSGTITGSGGLEKTGDAELILSGSNKYRGGTTISGGSLIATVGDALGLGTATISAAGTLALDFAGDQTFVNRIDGTGTLIKIGNGKAHLTATGSQAGFVRVGAGELSLEQSGAFTVEGYETESGATTSLGAGATLVVGDTFIQGVNSTLNIDAVVGGDPVVLTDSASLAGSLNVTGFSGGTLTSTDDLTGERFVVIRSASVISGDFDSVTVGSTADPVDYLTVSGRNDGMEYYIGFGLTWFAGAEKGDGIFTLSGSGDVFTVNTVLSDEDAHYPFNSGWSGTDLTKNGVGRLVLGANNTYTGFTVVAAGTMSLNVEDAVAASSSVRIAAGATLDMAGGDQTLQNLEGDGTVGLGGRKLTVASGVASEFSGVIDGTGSLVKTGPETFTLSGENTYQGGTTISVGTLVAGSGSALGTGAATVASGAVLELNFQGGGTMGNVIAGEGELVKTGAETATLTGRQSSIGGVTVESGNLSFEQTGRFEVLGDFTTDSGAATSIGSESTLWIRDAFTQDGASPTLNVAIGNDNQPVVTAGSATLGGNLNISGFQGDRATSATGLMSNRFIVVQSSSSIAGDFNSMSITSRGSIVDYLVVDGVKDDTIYSVGFMLAWESGSDTGHGTFNLIDVDDIFDVDVALDDEDAHAPFNSGWDGKELVKQGKGTLVLSRENTYTGATIVSGGILRTNVENAFADSESVRVDSGAVLDLDGNSQIANNLSGGGSIELGDQDAILTARNDSNTSFSGVISGSGALRKEGGGELLLSGANTYDMGTEINAGSIVAANGSALGAGAVSMASGTSLELRFDVDQTMSNQFIGSGDIVKTGFGDALLTARDSTVGSVTAEEGWLGLRQAGVFSAGEWTTRGGATTGIGPASTLAVAGTLTQDPGSTLAVAIGESPSITAAAAGLAGDLKITGLGSARSASSLTAGRHIVIRTNSDIVGDFSGVDFGGASSNVDYLAVTGHVDEDRKSYSVGFDLIWYADETIANGVFTLSDPADAFNVDVPLNDRPGSTTTGWDGMDLIKNGAGALTLSAENGYSGSTIVNGGSLIVTGDGTLGRTSDLTVAPGASVLLDSSREVSVGRLDAGDGAVINIARGTLVVTDAQRQSGGPSESFLQAGTLVGGGSLVLRSSDLRVSGANDGFSGDVVASGGSAIVMDNAAGLGRDGGMELDGASSLAFEGAGGPSGSREFGKSLSGEGSVAVRSGSDIALVGDNSAYLGTFIIAAGSTLRADGAERLGSSSIVDDGDLVLSTISDWEFENHVSGSGIVTKEGTGRLLVEDALQAFKGEIFVKEGELVVGAAPSSPAVLGDASVRVGADGILSGGGAGGFTVGRLINSGVVNIAGDAIGNTLTVRGGLVGESGRVIINTILGDDLSPTDRLVLDGGSAVGTTFLTVVNRGGNGAATNVGILVVETKNGAATDAGAFILDSLSPGYRSGFATIAAGAYEYALTRGGNGGVADSWYLVSNETVRPEAGVYTANREAAEDIFDMTMRDRLEGYDAHIDPDTGRKRLGGVWARARAMRARYSAGGARAKSGTFLLQTGFDLLRVGAGASGSFRAGIMGGVGTARSRADNGLTTSKGGFTGYQGGVYASWFQYDGLDEGFYVDSWVVHSWFKNHTRGGGLPSEKYRSTLWSASLEAGYAIPIASSPTSSWSIVPTAQIIHGRFDAKNFVEAGGTEIRHAANSGQQIRLGMRLDGRLSARRGSPAEPYVEVNWRHRTKTGRLYMNDDLVAADASRNHAEIKAGVTAELVNGLRVGAEIFAQFGEKGHRRLGGQIGLRKDW